MNTLLNHSGTAVVWRDSIVTYEALRRRVAGISRALCGHPVIAVSVSRGPDLLAALLACWHAGAAYVPLDPAYPEERLRFMLQDCRASLLVDDAFVARCPDAAWIDGQPGELAYIIYTSGSTGRPKGVEITHHALHHFLGAIQQVVGLRADERVLAHTPISFDIAGLELFWPLLVGATVVMATREDISHLAFDVMQSTPSLFEMLRQSGYAPGRPLRILCGGEAWHAKLLATLHGWASEVWNVYGPTEATIWVSATRVTDRVYIDGPLPGSRFKIEGEELFIAGPQLARGYHRRPELTAERFVDGWYATGDRVRTVDGGIEVVGRVDRQVKLRGHRIELGEIEESALRVSGVREAAAVLVDNHIALFAVGEECDLRAALSEELPEIMLPTRVEWISRMPLLPNGKTDRDALR